MSSSTTSVTYILVTGTNGGLGLGICTRLIDDFLHDQPRSKSLTLIFTTRSTRKGSDTLNHLEAHLKKKHAVEQHTRIHLRPENVELTNLLSIRALARKLLPSPLSSSPSSSSTSSPSVPIPRLDAVILNAGIGGWSGLNWPRAIGSIAYDIVTNTTWTTYKLGVAGLITAPQFLPPLRADGQATREEPLLGQIFCANVFGHYMLVHWLMPLLSTSSVSEDVEPGRVVWVSSIEPQARHLDEEDFMGLRTTAAYEHSKRITDLLTLTYNSRAAADVVGGFVGLDVDDEGQQKRDGTIMKSTRKMPTMHVAQPGICTTSIVTLHWIMQQFYVLGIYMARWAGSPWATASTYTAALVFSWLALSDLDEIRSVEGEVYNDTDTTTDSSEKVGRIKWGTAVTRSGIASVKPTEVENWGVNGSGRPFGRSWWGGKYGRAPGARDATGEDVDGFVGQGVRVWREMERLRLDWEGRMEEFDRLQKGEGGGEKVERI